MFAGEDAGVFAEDLGDQFHCHISDCGVDEIGDQGLIEVFLA